MVEVIKFICVRIIFLLLFLFVISIEGGKAYNWLKYCETHFDCSDDICKPPFKAYCFEKMCKCYLFENQIQERP